MNDLVPQSRQEIQKAGMTGIGAGVGGIALLSLGSIGKWPVVGAIVGGLVTLGGVSMLKSQEPKDKKAGAVITAAGAITLATNLLFWVPLVKDIARFGHGVMIASGIGLLGYGIWQIIRFVRGLKSRG